MAISNNFSTDLESSSTQYWLILDASQTGLDFSDQLSFSLWVKFESQTNTRMYWLSKRGVVTSAYLFAYDPENDLMFFNTGAGGSVTVSWVPNNAQWYQVGVTKNGTSVKFFVNGSQLGATQTIGASNIDDTADPFYVGTNGANITGDQDFDGLINSLLVYSVDVGTTIMGNLYTDPCNPSTTNLVSRWFDTVNNGNDQQGSNNLTGVNTPTFSSDVGFSCVVTSSKLLPLLGVGT
jgi:hypothetical protein